jgi:hypothetical protein
LSVVREERGELLDCSFGERSVEGVETLLQFGGPGSDRLVIGCSSVVVVAAGRRNEREGQQCQEQQLLSSALAILVQPGCHGVQG